MKKLMLIAIFMLLSTQISLGAENKEDLTSNLSFCAAYAIIVNGCLENIPNNIPNSTQIAKEHQNLAADFSFMSILSSNQETAYAKIEDEAKAIMTKMEMNCDNIPKLMQDNAKMCQNLHYLITQE